MSDVPRTEELRRELDEALERARGVELIDEIDGLGNPYLDTLLTLEPIESLYDRWYSLSLGSLAYARHNLVTHYSWAIPDEKALEIIGETGSVVEIGAGGGYWAAMLRARGVEVFAYDPSPGDNIQSIKGWTNVGRGRTKPVEKHPGSTLFLCWPAYQSRYAEIAVRRYLRAGGTRVAYIGEEEWGCCAEERFFGLMGQFERVAEHDIPQYPGIHDGLTVWDLTRPANAGSD